MPYEILVDWIDWYDESSVKLHHGEPIDRGANMLSSVMPTRSAARERAEYFGRNGFWQNGHRFIGPAQIAATSIRLVPAPKRKK